MTAEAQRSEHISESSRRVGAARWSRPVRPPWGTSADIAARGIHVDGIDLVIHADPPAEHKAYLHRSGRTARAGAAGIVITLQKPAQEHEVRALMRKASVVPLAARVSPHSALLRSIASAPRPAP